MTCMSPTDGVPLIALMSQLLTALGLPPDSWFIRRSVEPARVRGWPFMVRAWLTTPRHCSTPAPPPPELANMEATCSTARSVTASTPAPATPWARATWSLPPHIRGMSEIMRMVAARASSIIGVGSNAAPPAAPPDTNLPPIWGRNPRVLNWGWSAPDAPVPNFTRFGEPPASTFVPARVPAMCPGLPLKEPIAYAPPRPGANPAHGNVAVVPIRR